MMGNDGHTVLVKHGGSFFKCHRCHVMEVKPKTSVQFSGVQYHELPEGHTDEVTHTQSNSHTNGCTKGVPQVRHQGSNCSDWRTHSASQHDKRVSKVGKTRGDSLDWRKEGTFPDSRVSNTSNIRHKKTISQVENSDSDSTESFDYSETETDTITEMSDSDVDDHDGREDEDDIAQIVEDSTDSPVSQSVPVENNTGTETTCSGA